jgi:hypothetical protein
MARVVRCVARVACRMTGFAHNTIKTAPASGADRGAGKTVLD